MLAGLRTLRDEEEIRGDDTFQDPDDRVDPDERGPRLSVTLKEPVGEIYALPEPLEAEKTSGCCPDSGDGSRARQSPPAT